MRRLVPSLAVLALAAATLPASASAAFTLGVAAGEVRSTSAKLWAHATRSGSTTLQVSGNRSFANPLGERDVLARRSNDNTVQATAVGLRPGRTYYYRWLQGGSASKVGRFETAPAPGANATVRFAFTGDADATPLRGRPAFNRFQVYRRMMLERNDFNFNLGDTIYSDSEVRGARVARTASQKWGKYRQNLAMANLADLRGSTGIYSHWDDHEFINDFSISEHGRAIYRAGVTAFEDYAPVTYTARDGLYRTFRWGRNVELFLLDERSFRSAKASAGGTCDNPQTNEPDLAPTAPQQQTRNLFSLLVPSLSQPAPEACKARIADPSRTMLGGRQLQRFTNAVRRSNATFKIIMNEVPIQQFYALPYDRWEGYAAERQRVLDVLDDLKNVVFLTTDTHANFVNDVRFQTLEPGGPIDTGLDEFVTGPVATNTFAREIDTTINSPGAGQLVTSAFFKQAPPNGPGMKCANPDVYSYAQVSVTASQVTVEARDLNGRVVLDSTDKVTPCRLVVPRR